MAEKPKESFSDKLTFYVTASFILLATFSLFAFLFLVPFVIEPAFTTIFMEFDERPAFCETVDTVHNWGMSNCSWTSCKEGCTKDVYECWQIRVNYRLVVEKANRVGMGEDNGPGGDERNNVRVPRALRDYDYSSAYDEIPPEISGDSDESSTGMPHGRAPNGSRWYFLGARLFPNVKGCGYPPMLNCSIWYKKHLSPGSNFSCYYSQIDPGLVITDLDMWQVYMNLVYAIAIPIPSFIVSVVYLIFAYFFIYNEPPLPLGARNGLEETTPLPVTTPLPPPASGALTPASDVFREDLASFGHQLKVAMADDISRDSVFTDSVPLSTNSLNGAESVKQLIQIQSDFFNVIQRIVRVDRIAPFKVINHGDCWRGNMLFKYDVLGRILSMKFVDFQVMSYCSYAYDLMVFILSSVENDLRLNKLDELLEAYRESLLANMKFYDLMTDKVPTLAEMKDTLDYLLPVTIILISMYYPPVSNEFDLKFSDSFEKDKPVFNAEMYKSDQCKQIVGGMLQKMRGMDVLSE